MLKYRLPLPTMEVPLPADLPKVPLLVKTELAPLRYRMLSLFWMLNEPLLFRCAPLPR